MMLMLRNDENLIGIVDKYLPTFIRQTNLVHPT